MSVVCVRLAVFAVCFSLECCCATIRVLAVTRAVTRAPVYHMHTQTLLNISVSVRDCPSFSNCAKFDSLNRPAIHLRQSEICIKGAARTSQIALGRRSLRMTEVYHLVKFMPLYWPTESCSLLGLWLPCKL